MNDAYPINQPKPAPASIVLYTVRTRAGKPKLGPVGSLQRAVEACTRKGDRVLASVFDDLGDGLVIQRFGTPYTLVYTKAGAK